LISRAITVFGSAQPIPGSAAYEQARQTGRLLAQSGFTVVNGGYTGTMEGASQGAAEVGGRAVGVTCALFDGRREGANPYLTEEIHTPDLLSRLRTLVERGDGYIVLGGGIGTMLELFLVWNLLSITATNKPCVLVGTEWHDVLDDLVRDTAIEADHVALLRFADTSEDAVCLLNTVFHTAK